MLKTLLSLVLCGWFSLSASAADLQVFAAASLTDVLKKLGGQFGNSTRVSFNFAASSILARQIEEGAPADIFFPADQIQMERLEKKQLIENSTKRLLLGNSLVVVVSGGRTMSRIEDLLAFNRVALADPKSVPAGIYARDYLKAKGLWDRLEKKVVPAENVRAAMAAVESGNVDAAIVYRTDAGISKKVRVALEIPSRETPGIVYPVAQVKGAKNAVTAGQFLEFLASEKATKVFQEYGFVVLTK